MSIDRGLWDDNEVTGIGAVDDDHETLIRLYSEMVDTIDRSLGKDALVDMLARLSTFAATHFAKEEAIMLRLSCDGAVPHKEDHVRILQDLDDFRMNVESTFAEGDWAALAKYLNYKFIKHGQKHDKRLFLKDRSIGES